jgi:uroporphyrinogen-III synthase
MALAQPTARVIVTRPAGQAAHWVQTLQAQGFDAHSFPLIEISDALPADQRQALQERVAEPAAFDVCMWVSSNAVSYFYKQNWPLAQKNIARAATNLIVKKTHTPPNNMRHWATGPGTVAALQAQGIALQSIDTPDASAPQWDAEALWQRVAGQVHAGSRVLIVRGVDVGTPSASRDWLASQIRLAGGTVEFAAVYERRAPQFTAQQLAWARTAAGDGTVWVFSSSQAIAHLPDWPAAQGAWQQARCVATHERIAQAARAKGFAVVCTSRPSALDVAQSIKSMA